MRFLQDTNPPNLTASNITDESEDVNKTVFDSEFSQENDQLESLRTEQYSDMPSPVLSSSSYSSA
jgi:hypothetical protein